MSGMRPPAGAILSRATATSSVADLAGTVIEGQPRTSLNVSSSREMRMAHAPDICVRWKPAPHHADPNVTGVYAIDFGDRPEGEWTEYPAGDDTDAEFNRVVGRVLAEHFPNRRQITVSARSGAAARLT
jgi:hypothetical protein